MISSVSARALCSCLPFASEAPWSLSFFISLICTAMRLRLEKRIAERVQMMGVGANISWGVCVQPLVFALDSGLPYSTGHANG